MCTHMYECMQLMKVNWSLIGGRPFGNKLHD